MAIEIRDPAAVAALATATGTPEVRGPDGQLLGVFIPAPRPGMSIPECGLTDDELDRIRTDPTAKRYTAEEVMARLREIDRCSP